METKRLSLAEFTKQVLRIELLSYQEQMLDYIFKDSLSFDVEPETAPYRDPRPYIILAPPAQPTIFITNDNFTVHPKDAALEYEYECVIAEADVITAAAKMPLAPVANFISNKPMTFKRAGQFAQGRFYAFLRKRFAGEVYGQAIKGEWSDWCEPVGIPLDMAGEGRAFADVYLIPLPQDSPLRQAIKKAFDGGTIGERGASKKSAPFGNGALKSSYIVHDHTFMLAPPEIEWLAFDCLVVLIPQSNMDEPYGSAFGAFPAAIGIEDEYGLSFNLSTRTWQSEPVTMPIGYALDASLRVDTCDLFGSDTRLRNKVFIYYEVVVEDKAMNAKYIAYSKSAVLTRSGQVIDA